MKDKIYIDKGNEVQILKRLSLEGLTEISFESRGDHLGKRKCNSLPQTWVNGA